MQLMVPKGPCCVLVASLLRGKVAENFVRGLLFNSENTDFALSCAVFKVFHNFTVFTILLIKIEF